MLGPMIDEKNLRNCMASPKIPTSLNYFGVNVSYKGKSIIIHTIWHMCSLLLNQNHFLFRALGSLWYNGHVHWKNYVNVRFFYCIDNKVYSYIADNYWLTLVFHTLVGPLTNSMALWNPKIHCHQDLGTSCYNSTFISSKGKLSIGFMALFVLMVTGE